MAQDVGKADILVAGAVASEGHHLIEEPVSVQKALHAAGGLAYEDRMWPAGQVSIHRPLGQRKADVWRFDLAAPNIDEWMAFALMSGDSVTFAWHVEMTDDDASE